MAHCGSHLPLIDVDALLDLSLGYSHPHELVVVYVQRYEVVHRSADVHDVARAVSGELGAELSSAHEVFTAQVKGRTLDYSEACLGS